MSRPIEPRDVHGGAPLVHCRRIAWSDTDAARIVYTVRFFEFAMGAVEAWFRDVWGDDWYTMNTLQGVGSPFVRVEMDIHSSLYPEDVLSSAVFVERVGRSSLTFVVLGENQHGTVCYSARYVCTIATMEQPIRPEPISDEKRKRVEAYRSRCAEAGYQSPERLLEREAS